MIAELLVGAVGMVGGAGEIALAEAGMRAAMATRLAVGLGAGLAGGTASSYVGGKIFGEGSRGQRQMALGGGLLSGGLGAKLAGGGRDPLGLEAVEKAAPRGPVRGLTSRDILEAHRDEIKKVSTFETKGLSDEEADLFLDTERGRSLLKTLKNADLTADDKTIWSRASGLVKSGSGFPEEKIIDHPLVEIAPAGRSVSPYSPFFSTHGELESALASGKSLPDHFGLPIDSEADVYDIYEISPNGPTSVFVSKVTPTSELDGLVERQGGAIQHIVPNRSLWSNPVLVGSTEGL